MSFKCWPLQWQEEAEDPGVAMQRGWPASEALPAGCPLSFPRVCTLPTFCVLPGSCLVCSCSGNSRACPKPKTTAFPCYTSLWKDGFLTMDVRPEIDKAGLSLAATGTSRGAAAWGAGSSPGEELWPMETWLDALRGLMVLHAGLPQALVDFTWLSHPAVPFIHSSARPAPASARLLVPMCSSPRIQPANHPSCPSSLLGLSPSPRPRCRTWGRRKIWRRSLQRLMCCSVAAGLRSHGCWWWGTGTTPACRRRSASPRRRWAPLSQQHKRRGGNTSPSSACRGEPAQAIARGQAAREPGQPAERHAPAPSAGCERAYVCSEESWRG